MSKHRETQKNCPDQLACRLLNTEHQALVQWLHDDLGQSLVAIKSFSAAIMEQNQYDHDSRELAGYINDAAASAFRSSYDLMQELRAQQAADQRLEPALKQCLQESGLSAKNITCQLDLEPLTSELNFITKSIILRSVRVFINRCKLIESVSNIKVSVFQSLDSKRPGLELRLEHNGQTSGSELEVPDFQRLQDRIEAINGEMALVTDCDDQFILSLKFDEVLCDAR